MANPHQARAQVSGQKSRHHVNTVTDSVSVQEAASIAGVSERTITRWIRNNLLESFKANSRRHICRSSLQDLVGQATDSNQCVNTYLAIEESFKDIKTLIQTMVELYHPDSVGNLVRKRELQKVIDQVCSKHTKELKHD